MSDPTATTDSHAAPADSSGAEKHVRVGVGVFVINPATREVLIGRRKGSHGAGKYQLPGGHLEFGEAIETCAARELEEEVGFVVAESAFRQVGVTNDVMIDDDKHYITLFVAAEYTGGKEPEVLEPDKCEAWEWVPFPDGIPEPRFLPLDNYIKQGHSPFE